jgi:hypothetical protein
MIVPAFLSDRGRRSLYHRPSRLRRVGALLLTAAAGLGVACGVGKEETGLSAGEWLETDGAAGRINMDDVQQAYREAFGPGGKGLSWFEQRVNEIYEGDHLILIQSQRLADRVEVSGWEDLNDNKRLDENEDDKLFTIIQELRDGGAYEVRGHGANAYYVQQNPFDGFLTGYLLGQVFSGGRTVYVTPPPRQDELAAYRGTWRSGPGYRAQQSRNVEYGRNAGARYGSAVTAQPVSPARTSYQQRQVNSGGFRATTSTSRSITSGAKSSGGKGGSAGKVGGTGDSGGVKGGGGLMAR